MPFSSLVTGSSVLSKIHPKFVGEISLQSKESFPFIWDSSDAFNNKVFTSSDIRGTGTSFLNRPPLTRGNANISGSYDSGLFSLSRAINSHLNLLFSCLALKALRNEWNWPSSKISSSSAYKQKTTRTQKTFNWCKTSEVNSSFLYCFCNKSYSLLTKPLAVLAAASWALSFIVVSPPNNTRRRYGHLRGKSSNLTGSGNLSPWLLSNIRNSWKLHERV